MKTLITCAILILFHTGAWAQPNLPPQVADSLWQVWQDDTKPDTTRLKAIYDYAWDGYLFNQPDSAFYFAQLQYNFAKAKGLKMQMAAALNAQGVSFLNRGDYKKSIVYHTRSLSIQEEIRNKKGIAMSLGNIGLIYRAQGDYAKAMDFYTRSLKIKEEIGDKQGIANALNNIGIIYNDQGDYANALDYYTRSLKIREEIKDKMGIVGSFGNIGNIYLLQGDYANAIEYYNRTLKIFEEIGNKQGIANVLNNIGVIYQDQGDYANAIVYCNRTLKIQEEIGDKHGIAYTLNNIGNVYVEQGDYTKALDYHNRSLKVKEEIGDKHGIAYTLNNIGAIFKEQGDYTKALDYYNHSLKIQEEIGDKQGIAGLLNNIGLIYQDQGDYIRALEFGKRSIQFAEEVGDVIEIRNAAHSLWKVNKKIGNYKQSLAMHELYTQMRDSLQSEENIKEMARFEFKYEYEKKALADSLQFLADQKQVDLKHRVELAQTETERNIYISAGAALLMLSFLFFQRRHNRNKLILNEKEADYQREVLYATINSQESERRRIARDLHDEVGAMLSTIKLNLGTVEMQLKQAGLNEQLTSPARNLVDETINNVRGISKNLLPPTLEEFGLVHALNDLAEKVENASGISFKKDIQPLSQRLPIEHELALFRVIQEMINNALKHAEASEFTLTMRERNSQLNLCFADNGKGFDLETVKKSKSGKTGLGLKNLENRVGVARGEMKLKSSPGKGTAVEIWVDLVQAQELAA